MSGTSIRNGIPLLRALAVLLALLPAGCGAPARFVDPEADLPYYERVGIIPFSSLSQDRLAGEKVANIFMTELLNEQLAQVVDPGQFAAAMQRVRGGTPATNPWSTADLAKLGDEAGVQGIFLGTVREYEMLRSGRDSFPLVSIEARLVDAQSGRIVWSASRMDKGGPAFPLFAWTEVHTLGELSSGLCRDMLRTFK